MSRPILQARSLFSIMWDYNTCSQNWRPIAPVKARSDISSRNKKHQHQLISPPKGALGRQKAMPPKTQLRSRSMLPNAIQSPNREHLATQAKMDHRIQKQPKRGRNFSLVPHASNSIQDIALVRPFLALYYEKTPRNAPTSKTVISG
jgi:hypothetical protein